MEQKIETSYEIVGTNTEILKEELKKELRSEYPDIEYVQNILAFGNWGDEYGYIKPGDSSLVNAFRVLHEEKELDAITVGEEKYSSLLIDSAHFALKNPNYQNKVGRNILMYSAIMGDERLLLSLLKNESVDLNLQDEDGWTVLMYAIESKNDRIVKAILKDPRIDINKQNSDGMTALSMLAFIGNEKLVKVLLKHPQINYNLRDSDGNTALTLAVAQMPEPLSRGSSRICNSIGKPDHSTIVKLLLKQPNIDLNVVMSHGNSLISTLWEKLDHMSFLKVLNLNGGDIDLNIQDRDGSTLLFNAIMGDDGLIVLLLATNPKVNPNIQNNENETALMYAVIHNNTSAIQSLLKHPRINIKLKNKAGKTAWDMASSDIRHMFPKLKPKGV